MTIGKATWYKPLVQSVFRKEGYCPEARSKPKPIHLVYLGFAAWLVAALVCDAADRPPGALSAPGVTYSNWCIGEVPWSIHVVKVERANSLYQLESVHAGGKALGLDALEAQLKLIDPARGYPVAAVNGDFYQRDKAYAGAPRGLQVVNGELFSGPSDQDCCWVDVVGEPHVATVKSAFQITWPDGRTSTFGLNGQRPNDGVELYTPALGPSTHTSGGCELVLAGESGNRWLPLRLGRKYRASVREIRQSGDTPLTPGTLVLSIGPAGLVRLPKLQPGAVLQIDTGSVPQLPGIRTAIGGGPILVHNGRCQKILGEAGDDYELSSRAERHPRSAVGWNERWFFLVQVDGRQRDLSVGMTLNELSKFLLKLGCEEALNLDGGGSAALWYDGQIRNNPCDGYDRPIANCLVVVRKEPKSGTSHASLGP